MGLTDRLTVKNRALEYFVVFVVVVCAIAISFIFLSTVLARARDTQRVNDVAALRNALELYYMDRGVYPESEWTNSAAASWSDLGQALGPYIADMPRDPINNPSSYVGDIAGFNYSYYSVEGGQASHDGSEKDNYMLVFRLERPKRAAYYQEVDVGLVTAHGRLSFLPLARAEGVYVVRAP